MNYKTIVTFNNARIEVTPTMPQEFHIGNGKVRVELVPDKPTINPRQMPLPTTPVAPPVAPGSLVIGAEVGPPGSLDDDEEDDGYFPEIHPEDDLTRNC